MTAGGAGPFRLLVFVTVVDRNGYSAAARHLNLASHGLLPRPGAREDSSARRCCATSSGRSTSRRPAQEVYRVALVPLLHEQERLTQSLRDVRHGRRGRVRLGASIAFEQPYFFRRVIAPFCRAHEGTHLSLRFGHSVARRRPSDHEVDLAYVIGWQLPSGVHFEPLHSARFTFLVAPITSRRTRQCHGRRRRRGGDHRGAAGQLEWSHYEHVLREFGLESVEPVLEIDGIQARVLAAQAGLGVFGTFFPPYAGEDATATCCRCRSTARCPGRRRAGQPHGWHGVGERRGVRGLAATSGRGGPAGVMGGSSPRGTSSWSTSGTRSCEPDLGPRIRQDLGRHRGFATARRTGINPGNKLSATEPTQGSLKPLHAAKSGPINPILPVGGRAVAGSNPVSPMSSGAPDLALHGQFGASFRRAGG